MADLEKDAILIERNGPKGIITVNRPQVLNAIDLATFVKLQAALDELIADEDIRVIILTGAGKKSFISGGDIREELATERFHNYRWSQTGHKLCSTIENSPKPVVAAINGYCLGGGFEFVLACDIRICSENARFGAPETKLGITCGFGGNIRLPRIVGVAAAKEMLMTGEMIDAQEAYRINLVNHVVPQEELMPYTLAFCNKLVSKNKLVLEFVKRGVNYGSEIDMQSAIQLDAALWGVIAQTEDKVEGMTAFLEKREPQWKNQ